MTLLQGVQGYEATRMFRSARDDLVTVPPVEGEGAEVHAVGGALGESYILEIISVHEPGSGFAGAGVRVALVGVEVDALEIGRAGAQVVHLAYGLDRLERRRAAAAGVEIDIGVVSEGGKHLAWEIHEPLLFLSFSFGEEANPYCMIAASCIARG
jgi:hypothetical protein